MNLDKWRETGEIDGPVLPLAKWEPHGFDVNHPPINGYISDDVTAESFAMSCVGHGFSLPSFDIWLSEIENCPAKQELLEWRTVLREAIRQNHYVLIHHLVMQMTLQRARIDYVKGPLHKVKQANAQSAAQRKRAKNKRGDPKLNEVIASFARGEGTAKELWPKLYAALDIAGCDPEEIPTDSDMRKWRIDYISADGQHRHITFGNFQTKLTKARKS